MIDKLISFVTYFPENLCFHIGEYEFYGLCLKRGYEFPWDNRKERNHYLNELVENENVEDYQRFVYWYEQWYLERFHRKFSYRFILHMLCYCFLFFCLPAFITSSITWMIMFASCVLILLLAIFFIQKNMSRLYYRLSLTRMAVDMLIKNLKEEDQSENWAVEFSMEKG
jgi:hypothetical protein